MNRLFSICFMLVGASLLSGCGSDTTKSQSPTTMSIGTSPKILQKEYRILAKNLAQSLKPDANSFRNDKSMTQIVAEGHTSVMDLKSVKSTDSDIAYIASQAEEAFNEAIRRMERINALPKPPGLESVFVESFIHGLFGDVYGGFAIGVDADNKQQAINTEVLGLLAAVEKADGAHLLLPRVAKKLAAPVSSNLDRIRVDFDESWAYWGPYDWCCFFNNGPELADCTVVVEMKGLNGEVRKNVHYVEQWPSNSWLFARYDQGTQALGRSVGNLCVVGVQTVNVTILSPTYSTTVNYVYQGAEKDKDVAERCKDLSLQWRYQPFEQGILGGAFGNTERGVVLTLKGVPYVNKCRVDVNFVRGFENKGWYFNLDSWKRDEEKTLGTKELLFDPETIKVVISFPNTNHKLLFDLKVNK